MSSYVKLLGALHIAFGGIGLLVGAFLLLIFGGLAGLAGAASDDSFIAVPLLGAIGVFLFGLLLVLSVPGIIAGVGLLRFRPWARIFAIVLSALELLHFPFGTALGVFGLWVLLQPESEQLFRS
ncbi:MAG: hypothetical protein HY820_02715 [Acidobacteria bacterium]|nr:hypothetical protein [Acidobacteriota bacterium]